MFLNGSRYLWHSCPSHQFRYRRYRKGSARPCYVLSLCHGCWRGRRTGGYRCGSRRSVRGSVYYSYTCGSSAGRCGTRPSSPWRTICYTYKAGGVRVGWSRDPVSETCFWCYGTVTGEDPWVGIEGVGRGGSVQSVFVELPRQESSLAVSHFYRLDSDGGRGLRCGRDVTCCRLKWLQSYSGSTLSLPPPPLCPQELSNYQEPVGTGSPWMLGGSSDYEFLYPQKMGLGNGQPGGRDLRQSSSTDCLDRGLFNYKMITSYPVRTNWCHIV